MPTGSNPAILFENVSVCYRVPHERLSGIKEYAIRWAQRRIQYQDFWALRDVSFAVRPGEVFGIIGRNGAGKSTLLKVIARVLKPVEGRVVVRGAVAPLLELGGGFHPELTGRENVFMNMALLGHSRVTTAKLFDSIVEFAELGEFIDAPLRTYSTGMTARLGFSVATCLQPDILLVDEILAVGDSPFQQKCLERLFRFHEQGVTILIVSHGLGALEALCQRALLLEQGKTRLIGPVEQVVEAYILSAEERPPAPESQPAVDTADDDRADLRPQKEIFKPGIPILYPDYASLPETGGIYPAQGIFDLAQGSVTAWIRFVGASAPRDAVIFHTDDSSYVLYVSLVYSPGERRYLRRLVARAGGNRRVLDTFYGRADFPEAGVLLDGDDEHKVVHFAENTWRLAAMTWEGHPQGQVKLFVDGEMLAEKSYNERYRQKIETRREDPYPARLDLGYNPGSIAIGVRPLSWTGEIVQRDDGLLEEKHPALADVGRRCGSGNSRPAPVPARFGLRGNCSNF